MEEPSADPRFSLANERTYLAWVRTAFALAAGGVVAAKGIDFHHDGWRWAVAAPPLLAAAAVGATAARRYASYEAAIAEGRRLPVGRWTGLLGLGVALYVALVVVAVIADS